MALVARGTLLHQRYRIVRAIGTGGMGAVYEAVDVRLQNAVAVKQMTIAAEEADRAFEREAKLLAALRHPALPVVIDYFTDADGQFLVMQLIEGENLSHLLQRLGSPLPMRDVLACARALLDALKYLHQHEPPIIHRDLKPANVNRTPAGEYVLLDFGLAKGHGPSAPTMTQNERSIYGFTPTYAPPEQIRGLPSDVRSDLFALGAMLFHLAAGVPPPQAVDRLAQVATGKADPLDERLRAVPGLDGGVQSALARALALDARDRFQSAVEMRAAFRTTETDIPTAWPSPEAASDARRVDAALPSQAEVGRAVDLIVQVRFPDSPSLGLEDWPSKRRPAAIEQASEGVAVIYPTDPATGTRLPARLRLRIVASDFTTPGTAEQLVEVPPREYSKRVAFLMTPTRAGICRVNVEVYAIDAVFLGMIAVEAEALHLPVADAVYRVATLDLRTIARAAEAEASRSNQEEAERHRAELTVTHRHAGTDTDVVRAVHAVRPSAPVEAAMLPDRSVAGASTPEASRLRFPIRRWLGVASVAVVLIAAGVVMLHPRFGTVESPAAIAPMSPVAAGRGVQGSATQVSPPAAAPPPAVATTLVAPSAKTPPPPISDEDYTKSAVRNVLKDLCNAYEALDPDAARQVFPTINMAALRMQLNRSQYTSMQCTFAEPTFESVDPSAGTARIRVDVKRVFEHSPLDPKPDVSEQIAVMTLSRATPRGRWVVETAEYRPKPKSGGVK